MRKLKLLIDICLLFVTLFLMSYTFISPFFHEILGIILSVLIIIHLCLNFRWLKNTTIHFKKLKNKTKLLYFIDILILLSFLVTIWLGIDISEEIFIFKTSNLFQKTLFHHILGRISILLMLIHFGFHLKMIIRKITKDKRFTVIFYIVYVLLSLIIIIYLLYTLFNSFVWQSLSW